MRKFTHDCIHQLIKLRIVRNLNTHSVDEPLPFKRWICLIHSQSLEGVSGVIVKGDDGRAYGMDTRTPLLFKLLTEGDKDYVAYFYDQQ